MALIDPTFLLVLLGTMILLIAGVIGWFAVIKPQQRRRMEREHHRRKRQPR